MIKANIKINSLFLVSSLGFLFNLTTLFRAPANPQEVCGNQIEKLIFNISFRRFENCDSILFTNAYLNPMTLLNEGSIWQSRPGYIFFAIIFKPFVGNHTAIPFIITNFLILVASSFLAIKLLKPLSNEVKNNRVVLPAHFFIHSSIWLNPVTRAFFWTAHFQMFNILMPLLAIYLSSLICRNKMKVTAVKLLFVGSLLLFYSSAVVVILLFVISMIITKKFKYYYVAILAFPNMVWILLNFVYSGSFYDHATQKYRQYVWVLDDLSKENGLFIFLNHLQKHVGNYFYSFSDLSTLLNFGFVFLFMVVFVFASLPIQSEFVKVHLKISALLFLILWFSLALSSFYASRLNWTIVITLEFVICMLGLYALSRSPNLKGFFSNRWTLGNLFNYLFIFFTLVQICVFCLTNGPYS